MNSGLPSGCVRTSRQHPSTTIHGQLSLPVCSVSPLGVPRGLLATATQGSCFQAQPRESNRQPSPTAASGAGGGGGSTQSKGSTAPPWPFRKPRPCSHSPWGSREAACFSWASVPLLSVGSASTSGRFSLPAFGFCVLFFSCGCCCLEITCKLKIFFPLYFSPYPPPFFFLPLKPESEQGRRTSLEKFTRSVVSSAGFLPSVFLLLLVLVFQIFFFWLSPSLGWEGVQCFPPPPLHSPPFFFCKCLQLLFQEWNCIKSRQPPSAEGSQLRAQPEPSHRWDLWPLFKALRRKGPYCSWGWGCASSTAAWGRRS